MLLTAMWMLTDSCFGAEGFGGCGRGGPDRMGSLFGSFFMTTAGEGVDAAAFFPIFVFDLNSFGIFFFLWWFDPVILDQLLKNVPELLCWEWWWLGTLRSGEETERMVCASLRSRA